MRRAVKVTSIQNSLRDDPWSDTPESLQGLVGSASILGGGGRSAP